ncbi:putative nuclease HARBI1 [Ornithodoros turicata]|uniref:putative nuclease HARBI1 n=1 Tax=Ornithodoros turicata TaxID=34597 RepID=UPI00313A1F91
MAAEADDVFDEHMFVEVAALVLPDAFDEGEDDDEGRKSRTIPKVTHYAEETVQAMREDTFKSHFRLHRSTVEKMATLLAPALESATIHPGRPTIPAMKQLLVVIWSLANLESFRSVGDRFGVAKSTVFHCVRRVGSALLDMARLFVSWPSNCHDALPIILGFQGKSWFPNVLGAIDGSHIEITAPKENASSYVNRKGFHSVVLQAVCDHEMRFLHCSVGEAGSVRDGRVLRRSEVCGMLNSNHFPLDSYLVGDAAYPIGPHLLTPYRDNGHLTAKERRHNVHLSRARLTIERAFGLLKGRFRRLFRVETRRPDIIVTIIIVACIFHNACLMWGDTFEEPPAADRQDETSVPEDETPADVRRIGIQKREDIANSL